MLIFEDFLEWAVGSELGGVSINLKISSEDGNDVLVAGLSRRVVEFRLIVVLFETEAMGTDAGLFKADIL